MFTALFRRAPGTRSHSSPMSSGIELNEASNARASQTETRHGASIDEEAAFRSTYINDLDPRHSLDHRINATYDLSTKIGVYPKDAVLKVWEAARDLTTEHAPLEARRAGFALLKASASHPEILEDRRTLFSIIITPIDPSEAGLQISALERLTKQGQSIWPFEAELVTFLNTALDTCFCAAQDARKAYSEKDGDKAGSKYRTSKSRGLTEHTFDDSSRDGVDESNRARLDEERALIGTIYLVEDVLIHNPESFQGNQLEVLITRITSIASQTTSRRTLQGIVKILRALTSNSEVPTIYMPRLLYMLCDIYNVPEIGFKDEISTSLSNLLLSRIQTDELINVLLETTSNTGSAENSTEYPPLLRKLTESIFKISTKFEESCCVMLKAYGQLFRNIRLNSTNKKIFESCLNEASKLLYHEQDISAVVIDSVADLAALCGPDITNQTFEGIMDLIELKSGLLAKENITEHDPASQLPDCLIRLFLRCHQESSYKTARVYKLLLMLAEPSRPTPVRLSVMKLLARLRCNAEQAIEVVVIPDSQGLAGILCRTEATTSSQGFTHPQNKRESVPDLPQATRQGRSSVVALTNAVRSRSVTRSSNIKDQFSRPEPPLWMYSEWTKGLPEDPRDGPSQVVFSGLPTDDTATTLNLGLWLDIMIDVLRDGGDWEIYTYVLVHLPSQLSNRSLFSRFVGQLQILHNLILDQLDKASFSKPPRHTKMTAGDVALCLYHILTLLLAYHDHLGRRELDNLVRAFSLGINKWDRVGRCCIHALSMCCHEIPSVIDRYIFVIVSKLSQKLTQSDLALDILELLGGLARLPEACSNATAKLPDNRSNTTADDALFFKLIFGICIGYVRSIRDQRSKSSGESQVQATKISPRQSGNSGEIVEIPESRREFPEYVYALAYQVIIFWFLAIDVSQRAQHVGWIAKELASRDPVGEEMLEEQSQVILDLMHRTVFSDLGETEPAVDTSDLSEDPGKQLWLLGMGILTVEVIQKSNIGQITKRQASGTTHFTYRQNTAQLPEHHVTRRKDRNSQQSDASPKIFPSHVLLQLTSTLAPLPIPLQPIKLPNEDSVQRALRNFDRIDTVDGHKAGVIFVGNGQTNEAEILNNSQGTRAYEAFLSSIGTKVKLQNARFNTQGLDREGNTDGTETFAWRDRVTEIVFHVTTMMPTNIEDDPLAINKKKHIGNDRVKVIFNNSGKPFKFDTFPSEMNEVNIVITPEAHAADGFVNTAKYGKRSSQRRAPTDASDTDLFGYYIVETLTSREIPRLSAAAVPKLVSADALAGFVRQLALNASVFSQVWSELRGQGEYISSWRARLKEIKKLREKYGNTHTSANISYPMPADADAPAYFEGNDWTGNITLGGMAEPDQLLTSLDFTRWS